MVKAQGPVGPKPSPQQARPLDSKPDLNQAEAQKAKLQKAQRMSSTDAARLASQAGFQRLGPKSRKAFDIGDSSSQQYALPEDDVDPEAWSQERLESAQGSLSLASAQFGEVAAAPAEVSMAAAVVGSSYMPTEEDIAEMEDLAKRPAPHPIPMLEEVSNSVNMLFGIDLGDETPVGHKVLAAGLVVAGEPESVHVDKGKLAERQLADGVQKVTKRGNQAVGEAQKMNKGVNEKLNVQRTFMFRR